VSAKQSHTKHLLPQGMLPQIMLNYFHAKIKAATLNLKLATPNE
jgi:hypothetical protein